jgi:pimeloyl-ACP methyl ester carboxylesterase
MTTTEVTAAALTAENRSIEIDAATLVYRRFGTSETDAPPLLCLQHFRGNLDNWDPALVDRLAVDREVVLLDNRGVGASTGVVPPWSPKRTGNRPKPRAQRGDTVAFKPPNLQAFLRV